MASVDARNQPKAAMAGFVALLACVGLSAAADAPASLRYTTSWLGNSFGGGPDWVQHFAESLCVLPARYLVDLPYEPGERFMVSFCVAGDLFFTVDCKSAKVFVYHLQNPLAKSSQ